MGRLRRQLTYANVMATIAVFLVLGGGAYAAFHLPKNSVRSRNIVNGQVKSVDVQNNGLTGADIKEATLRGLHGSKGLVVKDANGVIVGNPLSVTEADLEVITPTGYVVRLQWGGGLSNETFTVIADYSGPDCTGTRQYPTTEGSGAVTFGKLTRPFDKDHLIAPVISPNAEAVDMPVQSYESVTFGCRNIGPTSQAGWPAKLVTRAEAGLPSEVVPPLTISPR